MRFIIIPIVAYLILTFSISFVGDIFDRADLMRTDVCHDIDHLSGIC
jgi:hypothetical protein